MTVAKALPVRVYFITASILVFTGILASGYLSIHHYKIYTDIVYDSFCSISKAINCDTVSQSPYATFLNLPVSVWGVTGYVFLWTILFFSLDKTKKKMRIVTTLIYISTLFSIISLWLGIISYVKIKSYCLVCIITYGVNFMLLFLFWLIRRRYPQDNSLVKDISFLKKRKKKVMMVVITFLSFLFSLNFFYPTYWHMSFPAITKNIKTGITGDGHHWIGSEHPELTITEYTDYLCFQCRKMHFYLRTLVAEYPDKIRLVHKHFPLDKKFNFAINEDLHPGAGEMAMLAIYAGFKDKFWKMNDALFEIDTSSKKIDLNKLGQLTAFKAEELAWALNQKDIRLILKKDIAQAAKDKVTGTPSYIINGQLYEGTIPTIVLQIRK